VTNWKWGDRTLKGHDPHVGSDGLYLGTTVEDIHGKVYRVRGTWSEPGKVAGSLTHHQGGPNGNIDHQTYVAKLHS
jgi:hypothetical protein